MKPFKFVLSLLALSIAFCAPIANAQKSSGKKLYVDRVKEAIPSLTDDHYSKIKTIMSNESKQRKALPDDSSKKEKEAALMAQSRTEIRAVLTPAQLETYNEKFPDRKNSGKKTGDKKGSDKKGGSKKKKSSD